MRPPLVLFDDAVARDWRPFTLTRPAGELLFGTRSLRGRAEAALGLRCAGHIAAPHLASCDEPDLAPVLDRERLDTREGMVLLSSRFVAEPAALPEGPALLVHDGRVIGCRLDPGASPPHPAFFDEPDTAPPDLPRHELPGSILERVWELVSGNPDRVARDLHGAPPSTLPPHVHRIGDGTISLAEGVQIQPGTVLDTRHGPIRLEAGVEVMPFTHLSGPAWIGPGSTLLSGAIEAVSVGPVCKIHGRVEESVVLGYSNKAHDGFLGHSYLGMWVNLGALTTTSDLKNTYGTVRIWTPAGEVDTGQQKLGCLFGDHVKTAIGTLLNTGTVIEVGSTIFGPLPPLHVPPFSWGDPQTPHRLEAFLTTAARAMARRQRTLTDGQNALLCCIWEMNRGTVPVR